MGFKEQVAADNAGVFICLSEFAETRNVVYNGANYADVPMVISGPKVQPRKKVSASYITTRRDMVEGLLMNAVVVHMTQDSLGGLIPEKGQRFKISEREGGTFYRTYYVISAELQMGMLRLELEDVDE